MTRGRSVSRKRSIKGKSNPGILLRQPCRYYLKGTCTRSPCELLASSSVNSTKLKRVAKPGISVCSRIIRLMTTKQTKNKERQLFPQKKRKRRQECSGYCGNCTTFGLRLARLGAVWFSKRQTRETRCKKSWDRFDEYDSLSLRYVKQVSGKRKEHRLEKYKVKNPHQRSPYALKLGDWSQKETERQQRCARSKARNLAKNI